MSSLYGGVSFFDGPAITALTGPLKTPTLPRRDEAIRSLRHRDFADGEIFLDLGV